MNAAGLHDVETDRAMNTQRSPNATASPQGSAKGAETSLAIQSLGLWNAGAPPS